MKRILFAVFISLCVGAKASAGDFYAVGVDAFKKGAYDNATSNFEHAVRINPQNVNARYYLAQCYLKKKRNFDAQDQYERIILLAPDSDAAVLSFKGISLIQNAQTEEQTDRSGNLLSNYKDNYFDYVTDGNGVFPKWGAFPLNVYIEPSDKKNAVKKAFNIWQGRTKNLVNFNFVNSKQNAQITVDFKTKLESTSTEKSYIAGYSKPYIRGNKMEKSEIHLLTVDPDTGQAKTDAEITSTALHEIGHSLGINGHSPNKKDIMFATSDSIKQEITQRDVNTIYMFYALNNTALASRNIGQKDLKLEQTLDYVKENSDKSVGYINLGDIYRTKKMYPEAIKYYNKAIEIEPDKADTYNIAGATYILAGDTQNAYLNLKKACDLEPSNSNYVLSFGKVCLAIGRKNTGLKYINDYLSKNPQDTAVQNLLNIYNKTPN